MPDSPFAVLVVDDEPAIVKLLETILRSQGYDVSVARDGIDALEAVKSATRPDLILLDLELPRLDGFETIKAIRIRDPHLPIIVLSIRSDEESKVTALELGADDYLTKPFNARELLDRISAALRNRQHPSEAALIVEGDLEVNLINRTVKRCGEEIGLSSEEYALLSLLLQHRGRLVTHASILKEIGERDGGIQSVRTWIRSLRQKLGDSPEHPRYIKTELGVGYRFDPKSRGTDEDGTA